MKTLGRLFLSTLVVVASLMPATPASASPIDWRDEAIYMVMTDRFRNGDPSNDLDSVRGKADWWQGGDLQGVIDELDYIKDLGMTAIWITPVALQMRGGYHGYWTLDPYAIDPHLGTLSTLQELVRRAHEKGLKIVLDVVPNHLGIGHPWLTDGAHAGWFHPDCPINFADQSSVENCWLAGLPDLNTENPVVRAYLIDWANWLVDQTGVDGFRVDAARHLSKDFLRAFTSGVRAKHPNFWMLGEVYSSGYRYQSGFLETGLDAVTDFQTYDSVRIGLDPRGNLGQLTTSPSLAADLGAGNEDRRAIFIDNHDVPRFVGGEVPDAATKTRLAQALVYLFTMPGTPVLYYGTEVALPGGPDPDDRRPMPWTGGDETVRQLVRDLATMRQAIPSLRRGSFDELQTERGLVVYDRRGGPDVAVIAINGDEQRSVDVPLAKLGLDGGDVHRTMGSGIGGTIDGGTLHMTLAPRAAGIFVVGAASRGFALPLWSMLLIAIALLVIAAAITVTRARRRSLHRV
ncbi:MAG TPA: alpha-amylase family glycosyl hydrolase [Candidatus Limnocylindria bacterium]